MPGNFPNPLTILGIPSPRELFDEFVNLKERITKLEKELASNKKKLERQNEKIDRIKANVKKLKLKQQQLKTTIDRKKKKKKKPSSPIRGENKLVQIIRERKERKKHD